MKKDATQCKNWEHFVNVYRAHYGTNEGLDDVRVRNMGEKELERAIWSMTSLMNCKKYDFSK